MKQTYHTNEIAKVFGVHPNTVRLYEDCEFIQKPIRLSNGYRVFTDLHIEQFRLARALLHVEVMQNGLRKCAIAIIKTSAKCQFEEAKRLTEQYIDQMDQETKNAKEAIEITRAILNNQENTDAKLELTRKETADYLDITVDTLRNWELNGLLEVKRKNNGYRVYTSDDIKRLKIIRSLRCANYSLSAILRLLNSLSVPSTNSTKLLQIIDTPDNDDDVISTCDKLLSSLSDAKKNALYVLQLLEHMKELI